MKINAKRCTWLIGAILFVVSMSGAWAASEPNSGPGLGNTHYDASKRALLPVYKTAKAINYGPFRGAGPDYGEIPTDTEVLQDLGLFKKNGYRLIRLFGSPKQPDIVRLASEHYPQLRFQIGIFFINTCSNDPQNPEEIFNQQQIQSAVDLAMTYKNVVAVSVGSETQLFGMPLECLEGYIQQVRGLARQPITTNQVSGFYRGGDGDISTVLNNIDFVAFHEYPYFAVPFWDWRQLAVPAGMDRAAAMMEAALQYMKSVFDGIASYEYVDREGRTIATGLTHPIIVGETGWKAYGTDNRDSFIPGIEDFERYTSNEVNQKWYFDLLDEWQKSTKDLRPINIFAFSGMDEHWKSDIAVFNPFFDVADGGWGLWNAVRAPNYVLCGKRRTVKCNRDVYAGAGYFGKAEVVDPQVKVIANRRWRGFLSDANFNFSLAFPIALLTAEFEAPEAGQGELVLGPRVDTPGPTVFRSFLYSEDRELLPGRFVEFSGTCLRDSLPSNYSVEAQIFAFTDNFQFLGTQSTNLRNNCNNGNFTVSLDTANMPGVAIIQYGFALIGPATNQNVGNIVIQVEDDGFPGTDR